MKEVWSQQVFDVVQDRGRVTKIIDPTIGLVPVIHAADVDVRRKKTDQFVEAML